MAVIAALIGVAGVVFGLAGSFWGDTPAGPSIVVALALAALASSVTAALRRAAGPS
jgi:ABC-type Mn2+/Zn2+ transport system permease subunit